VRNILEENDVILSVKQKGVDMRISCAKSVSPKPLKHASAWNNLIIILKKNMLEVYFFPDYN
jgi:hypothetical protein